MSTTPSFRRPLFRLAAVALLASSLTLLACGGKQQKPQPTMPELPVMTIEASSASVESVWAVRLEGRSDAQIRPQVEGAIQSILVREGQRVQRGQTLFIIDDSLYHEAYKTALAARNAAEAQAAVASVNVQKLIPLVKNRVVSPVQLTTASAEFEAAKAQAEQAAAAARTAQINLGYTKIKAPVSGYIGRIPFQQGNLVTRNQSQALTTLSDVNGMYAVFSMSESAFADFKKRYPGATLQNKIDAVPPVTLTLSDGTVYPHEGKLESISGSFDSSTGSIALRVSFPNDAGLLRSGNSGTVTLRAIYDDAILVPQASTVELQDKVMVSVLGEGNKVVRRVITVEGASGQNYIVSDGIEPGEVIVTAGIGRLQDGTVIKPIRGGEPSEKAAPANPAKKDR